MMRKATTSLLYHKILSLSQRSLAQATTGKIVNLSSGDIAILEKAFIFAPYIFISPFILALCFGLIFWTVSYAFT